MDVSLCERHCARVRPHQAVTKTKLFNSFDSRLISAKEVIVKLLQTGFCILAHAKTGSKTARDLLLLKDHYRVSCLCQAIRGHQSQCATTQNGIFHDCSSHL